MLACKEFWNSHSGSYNKKIWTNLKSATFFWTCPRSEVSGQTANQKSVDTEASRRSWLTFTYSRSPWGHQMRRMFIRGNFYGLLEAEETLGDHNLPVVPKISWVYLQEPYRGLLVKIQEITPSNLREGQEDSLCNMPGAFSLTKTYFPVDKF